MNQSEDQMTARIISAINNPHVDVIAHPTCRILGVRDPIAVNLEAVFTAAAQHKTALEISAIPSRLDLKDIHVYQAREMGVKLMINTDSHRTDHLDFMCFGIGTARRGWCESKHILNTLPLKDFIAFLSQ
jgi:DNA polymerase (family 10)